MEIGAYTADEDLFVATRSDGRTRLRVYRPARTQVVLGRGSRAEVELYVDACSRDGVALLRRRGGGCAVVLDEGCAIVSLCLRAPGLGQHRRWFERISDALIQALGAIGVAGVYRAGISDLALDDRKLAGACMHRVRDTLYYSASLLVDPDISRIERYLRHPPREPDYRRGRSHGAFLTSLAERAGLDRPREVVSQLTQRLLSRLDRL